MTSRDRILDGAAAVMRGRGLANTTTREIAKTAGLSEAMLYKVFTDKADLFLAVLSERLPQIALLRDGYADHVGQDTVSANLRQLVHDLLAFYLETFPIAASVFSDPALLSRHHTQLGERGAGPHKIVEGVAGYLAAEKRAGRIAPVSPTRVIAELLVGACLHRAFLTRFAGDTLTPNSHRRFAADIVRGLEPTLAVT